MTSSICPHGVKRDMLYEDKELRAFTENCAVCTKAWKSGEEISTYWSRMFIGQTIDIRK